MTDPGPDTTPAPASINPAAATDANADRPEAPDIGPGTVHVPGQAPGQHILDGPASMVVGARRPKSKPKK